MAGTFCTDEVLKQLIMSAFLEKYHDDGYTLTQAEAIFYLYITSRKIMVSGHTNSIAKEDQTKNLLMSSWSCFKSFDCSFVYVENIQRKKYETQGT